MTLTAQQIARFYRCGELYRLADIEEVPLPPTTAQIVSRAVRDAIQCDLRSKADTGALLSTPEARSVLESRVRAHLSYDLSLTDSEATMGNRRIFETVLLSAQRMLLMWRSVVASKISVFNLYREATLTIGVHTVTCLIEIQELNGIRATKVRSRRPEDGEASRDLVLAIQALAVEQMDGSPPSEAVVDYLIDTKEMAYVRQVVEFDFNVLSVAQERIKIALEAIEEGVFVPADSQAWWCQACQLRTCCRYVA